MQLRRPVLMASLAALGVTVLAGAAGIVLVSDRRTDEVVGSLITTLGAIACFIALSFLIDRLKLRVGAMVAGASVMLTWALILGIIWLDGSGWSWEFQRRLGDTLLSVIFTGFPIAGLLMLGAVKLLRVSCWVLSGFIACALACFLGAAWLRFGMTRFEEQWLVSGMAFYGIGAAIAGCLIGLQAGDRQRYRWAGVGTGAVALGLALLAIWWGEFQSEFLARAMFTMATITVILAHAVITNAVRLSPGQEWLRWCTHGLGWATGMLLLVLCVTPEPMLRDAIEMLARAAAAFGVVTVGLTLTLLVLWRLNIRRDATENMPLPADLQSLDIVCPGCARKQHVAAGKSACTGCGLRFEIKVEEPRCVVCGYLLYRIGSDRCPECGTPVRASAPTDANAPTQGFPVAPAAGV